MTEVAGVVRTEIDGVPVHWVQGSGDLKAALIFRVGQADEQLATRGITHLIEHLALYRAGGLRHDYNGQVDAVSTVFVTHGTPDKVADVLSSVCRSLHNLPLDRLEAENRILRTEADGQGGNLLGSLLHWRYGAASYGLSAYGEFGVGSHTPDQLTAWAARWFTRGNAVLALIGGPPPEGLRLELPDGPRMAPPEPTSALPRTPAYFHERFNGIAMSTLVPRNTASQAYTALLGRRLMTALRMDGGLSYQTAARYDLRDAKSAHVLAVADGLRESHEEITAEFLAEIERLSMDPAGADEFGEVRDRMLAELSESAAEGGPAVAYALDELLGRATLSLVELRSRIEGLTPERLRQVAAEALDAALFMLPHGQRPKSARYRPAPDSSLTQVEGRTLRSADYPVNRQRLVIGADGVTRIAGPQLTTVRFAECEAMLAFPDGARYLFGRDGFNVGIEPTLWADGTTLPTLLDQAVARDRVVRRPERAPTDIPRPRTSRWDRLGARLKRS